MRAGIGLVVLLSLTGAAAAATAPAKCYRGAEIEADQAIKYQTELMVLSDACRAPSYVAFLTRNQNAVIAYQHVMERHFSRTGARDGQAALDRYMTQLANRTSLAYEGRSRAALCSGAARFLTAGGKVDGSAFHKIAAARAADRRTAYRACE